MIKIADVGCPGSAGVGSMLGVKPPAGFLHNKLQRVQDLLEVGKHVSNARTRRTDAF